MALSVTSMEILERLKSGWDGEIYDVFVSVIVLLKFCQSQSRCEVSGRVYAVPCDHLSYHMYFSVCFHIVHLWRRVWGLHCQSGWASVMSLCADSSHQSYLPTSIPAATIHCQAPGHRVSACTERTTVHGLCQGSSLWVGKNVGHGDKRLGENLAMMHFVEAWY